jgi:mannose-6-phosphate isomerase-like protein (cupin superfamily)
MNIIPRTTARSQVRPSGNRLYYDFPEYSLHLNEIKPGGATDWHHHEKIWETVFVVKGTLVVRWKENGETKQQTITEGDVVEVADTPQSFANETDELAVFLDIKQVLSGEDKQELLKTDKVVDE